jgi:hypothetical protein
MLRRCPTARTHASRYTSGCRDTRGKDMNILKTLTVLAFGSVLLAWLRLEEGRLGCQTGTPSPAVETPAPPADDTMAPADTTGTMPSDQPAPATSDSLPTDEQPPPEEPARRRTADDTRRAVFARA